MKVLYSKIKIKIKMANEHTNFFVLKGIWLSFFVLLLFLLNFKYLLSIDLKTDPKCEGSPLITSYDSKQNNDLSIDDQIKKETSLWDDCYGELTFSYNTIGITTKSDGLIIDYVFPNKPAAKAGLKKGDILLEVDGQKTENLNSLTALLNKNKSKKRYKFKILRKDEKKIFTTRASRTKVFEKGEFSNGILIKGEKKDSITERIGSFNKNGLLKKGKLTTYTKTIFEGNFDDGYLIDGKVSYKNGDVFEGKRSETKNYIGKFKYSNGSYCTGEYEGEFFRLEKGVCFFDNGNKRLEGDFKDNFLVRGKSFDETGKKQFEGVWENKKYKNGIEYFENGNKRREGNFRDGVLVKGILYYESGKKKFEGEFGNDGGYKQGIAYYENGEKHLEGDFKSFTEGQSSLTKGISYGYGLSGKIIIGTWDAEGNLIEQSSIFSNKSVLAELIKKRVLALNTEFISENFHKDYHVHIIDKSLKSHDYKLLNKKQYQKTFSDTFDDVTYKRKFSSQEVSAIRIIEASEIDNYASITWTANIKKVTGRSSIVKKISGVSVFLVEGSNYSSIYDFRIK